MKILLAITSSISAYKMPFLVSMLKKKGHEVICAVTKNAEYMVGVKALETMSGNPVIRDMWDENDPLTHINISRKTDVFLLAPADANTISKIANGICDNMITTIACAYTGKKMFAPAMNTNMWFNKALQKNVHYLIEELEYMMIGPASGNMACNDVGVGRLADLEEIVDKVINNVSHFSLKYDNIKFTVTSGATKEWIDPIRYITNNSTGKMGEAIYNEIHLGGGISTYIEGEVNNEVNVYSSDKKIKVDTTEDLKNGVLSELDNTDILIMAAAPLDFRPAVVYDKKVKKQNISSIELKENDDILASTKDKKKKNTLIVSFAAETAINDDEIKSYALDKMSKKGADMIVANNIKDAIGKDTNKIIILFKDGRVRNFPVLSKKECAKAIVSIAVEEWKNKKLQ